MRNTTLSQLPDCRRGFLYYIAAFCLLLCLSTSAALPAHAGGVDSGLDDVKDQYDGLVNDSALGFVQAVTSWIPTEFWVIVGLSIGSLVVLGIVSWLKG